MFIPCKKGYNIFSLRSGKRGFTGLIQKFSRYTRQSNKMAEKVTKEMAEAISRDTKININSSLTKRTGELENSVYYKSVSGILKTYEVGVSAPYAEYPEFGTGIHNIFGKGRKDGWVYKDEFSGEFYHTEGQKPQLFFNKALHKNLGRFSKLLKKEVRRQLR